MKGAATTGDLKGAEDALCASEALWKTVLENSTVGIAITDMEGRFEITNGVYQKLLGYSEEEMRQITFLEVTAPEFREQNWKLIEECLEGKRQQFDIEKQYRRKDGTLVWVRNNVLLVPGADGRPRHIMAVVDNISARKRAEESLRASEERWRSVFDNTAVGIALVDAAGNHVATNSAYQRMLGYSEKEFQELSYEDVTHEEDVETSRTLFGRLVEDKSEQLHSEKRCRRRDGAVVWVKTGVSRVLGAEGRTGLFAAVVADITERKRADEERERLRQEQRVIFEAASDVVLGTDETGVIRYANPATRSVFGFEPRELIGRPLTVLMPEALRGRHESAFKRYQATGRRQLNWNGTELTGLRRSGEEFPVEVSFGELTADGRRVFTGFIRDITERKRAEEERRKTGEALMMAQEKLAQAAQGAILGELAASIAHEINQPLAAVVANGHACVRWLSASPANLDRARLTAENIVRDGKAAAEFVQRIRGLFKHTAPEKDSLDIKEVLAEVIGVMEDEIVGRGGRVATEFEAKLPHIVGDRIQIQQVVINLIRNALDAMEDLDRQVKIVEIRARLEGPGSVAIEVLDRGCGIEDAEKIFVPFFTTKKAGMGVGLSICRSIVHAHGGRLRAVSNESRGSRLIVSLPAENRSCR